jgi:hypothetical protein
MQALAHFTTITADYADLALADRARVSRALLLYQTGQVSQVGWPLYFGFICLTYHL